MTDLASMGLAALARRRNTAAKAVKDWMDAEGREGRLRTNEQSPGWAAYDKAERDLWAAIQAVGVEQ
jgi:hypothetical protein